MTIMDPGGPYAGETTPRDRDTLTKDQARNECDLDALPAEGDATTGGMSCFRGCANTKDRRACADQSGLVITVCQCACHEPATPPLVPSSEASAPLTDETQLDRDARWLDELADLSDGKARPIGPSEVDRMRRLASDLRRPREPHAALLAEIDKRIAELETWFRTHMNTGEGTKATELDFLRACRRALGEA